jgi:trimethylamine--corrinoid protein Co-methyltransferase
VIDDEISRIIGRMAQGIEVSDETLAIDVVDKTGPGKDFLGQRHTVDHFRKEHFIPVISDRSSWDSWVTKGSRSTLARAGDEVRRIMKEHTVEPVRSEVSEVAGSLTKKRTR